MKSRTSVVLVALTLLAMALATVQAVRTTWLCDDSFITFRYAENLVAGHGLVYNEGERVEGYSNLLWTLAVAAAMWAGIPPESASVGLGLTSFVGLGLTLLGWSLSSRSRPRSFLPLAALCVFAMEDFHQWATGGLETMAFTFLVTLGLVLTRTNHRGAPLTAALLVGLASITRPDGFLFIAAGAASYGIPAPNTSAANPSDRGTQHRLRIRNAMQMLVVAGSFVIAQFVFRLSYYGEPFPTAYYSKSATDPYLSQGLLYLGLLLAKNWFLVLGLAIALVATIRSLASPKSRVVRARTDGLFFFCSGALYATYVVYSGGDFMFARRLIPALPLLLLSVEESLHLIGAPKTPTVAEPRFGSRSQRLALAVAAALILAALLPYPVFREDRWRIKGIAWEPHFYPPDAVAARRQQAELVGQTLRDSNARVMFEGGMCMFGYYSKLPYLAEMTGLTQYTLAKLPIDERGFIGHEKQADETWLRQNGIHFVISQAFPPVDPDRGPRKFNIIYFGHLARGRIVQYDDRIMALLRDRSGVTFMPIDAVVARGRREVLWGSGAQAREAYKQLDHYYFQSQSPKATKVAKALRAALDSRRF